MIDGNTPGRGLVLVVGMLKGGTGKTTTAVFSALHYAEQGRDVVVLDGDQTSQSAYDWARLAQSAGDPLPFEVVRFPFADDVAAEVARLRTQHDVVVIDAGGGSAQYLEEACSAADVLLMPLAPTGFDARRLAATLQSAERAAQRNPGGLIAYVTMVRADARTSAPRRWRQQLLTDKRPLTDTSIGDRVLYADAYGRRPAEVGEYAALLCEVGQELAAV